MAAAAGGGGGATINGIVVWDKTASKLQEFKYVMNQRKVLGSTETKQFDGAMMFIIDPAGHVLCGQESPFMDETEFRHSRFIEAQSLLNTSDRDVVLYLADTMKQKLIDRKEWNKNIRIPLLFNEKNPGDMYPQSQPPLKPGLSWYENYPRKAPKLTAKYGVPKGSKETADANPFQTITREIWEEVGIDFGNLPGNRIHYYGILDARDPSGVPLQRYAIFVLDISENEKGYIKTIIQLRNNEQYGEVSNLDFRDLSNRFLPKNEITEAAYNFIKPKLATQKEPITLLGGRRRRITRKRSKRSKRSMKKTARRTRRR